MLTRFAQLEPKSTIEARQRGKGLNKTEKVEFEALPGQISALDARLKLLRESFKADAVLRFDDGTGTFTKGYMIGAMVCVCLCNGKDGKKLAACSGLAPGGFAKAVESAGFECASSLVGSGSKEEPWMCAAKQIMQKHEGHKPAQLIERWFSPVVEGFRPNRGVKITFQVRMEEPVTKTLSEPETRTQEFKSGENVPSCAKCQENLPGMYCRTNCG